MGCAEPQRDKTTFVAKFRGRECAHAACRLESRCVVVGQEPEKAAREHQRRDRFLIEPRGLARQLDTVAEVHVWRMVAKAGERVLADALPREVFSRNVVERMTVAAREQQRRQRTPVIAQDAEVEERDLSVYDGLGAA